MPGAGRPLQRVAPWRGEALYIHGRGSCRYFFAPPGHTGITTETPAGAPASIRKPVFLDKWTLGKERTSLLDNAKKVTSLIILMLGIAIVARTVLADGAALSVGLVAGLAFTIYGAVRLYYFLKAG